MNILEQVEDILNPDTDTQPQETAQLHMGTWLRIKDLRTTMAMPSGEFDSLCLAETGKEDATTYTKADWRKVLNAMNDRFTGWRNGST